MLIRITKAVASLALGALAAMIVVVILATCLLIGAVLEATA